jgi:hypothetical protein
MTESLTRRFVQDDGPPRIRVGSRLAVPGVLQPFGDDGAPGPKFAAELVAATEGCEEVTPRAAPATSTLATPFSSMPRQRTTGRVHGLWANRQSRPITRTISTGRAPNCPQWSSQ